jgi:ribosome biogenesis GTPase
MDTTTPFTRLAELGWTTERERSFEPHAESGLVPGRVVAAARDAIRAATASGTLSVIVQRGFRRSTTSAADFPVVGDWLALEPISATEAALRAVLPRTGSFSRGDHDAQRTANGIHAVEQVVAANVDTVVIVGALNGDFNIRRLERYLALAWSSGAQPVLLLNKADLCHDIEGRLGEVRAIAGGAPVLVTTATTGEGLAGLREYLGRGRTVVLLGSSGVGKSTITNQLLGEERQAVRDVREDDSRGRHTTTARELFQLPSGGLLIDTPGMRSIGMWAAADGLDRAFDEIDRIVAGCRFNDCSHESEPGCAVRAAIAAGELDPERLRSRRKLERELRSIETRSDVAASRAESRRLGRIYRDAGKTPWKRQRWEAWS